MLFYIQNEAKGMVVKMIKIVSSHLNLKYNFGGPSILHGFLNGLQKLGIEYSLIHYYDAKLSEKEFEEWRNYQVEFKLLPSEFTFTKLLGFKVGSILGCEDEYSEILRDIKDADIVIDLYGICFCENLEQSCGLKEYIRKVFYEYKVSVLGRFYNKKVIKGTCSYGPAVNKKTIFMASVISKYVFNSMYARERKSAKAIYEMSGRRIKVVPDVANIMPYEPKDGMSSSKRTVAISVSHQIVKQWNAAENYYECISNLVQHIYNMGNIDVFLIPNEYSIGIGNSDVKVAERIIGILKEKGGYVPELLDVYSKSSLEIKDFLAACDMVIASRYHTCVAAISTGVPVLILGWHYKYTELLTLYGQADCYVSNTECDFERIKGKFDYIWKERENRKKLILIKKEEVEKKVLDTIKNTIEMEK